MKIGIDIGHANGTGARGGGEEEHELSKHIGHWLATILRTGGHVVEVIDYPDSSNTRDLEKTIWAANIGGYDVGLSLHCDASDNEGARGASVLFYPGSVKGSKLAVYTADKLCREMQGRANAVMSRPNLAVLRRTRCPWVLVECGFITNEGDRKILKEQPEKVAGWIAEGVLAYCERAEAEI